MTVTGVGFHGFAVLGVPAAAGLARCRFGGAAGAEAEATPINDTALLCAVHLPCICRTLAIHLPHTCHAPSMQPRGPSMRGVAVRRRLPCTLRCTWLQVPPWAAPPAEVPIEVSLNGQLDGFRGGRPEPLLFSFYRQVRLRGRVRIRFRVGVRARVRG